MIYHGLILFNHYLNYHRELLRTVSDSYI